MNKLRRRTFGPVLATVAMLAVALPARAQVGSVVFACPSGTLVVWPVDETNSQYGLGLPVVHNALHARWQLSVANCIAVSSTGFVGSAEFGATGHLIGYCGFSSASGSGDINLYNLNDGFESTLPSVSWMGLENQLLLTAEHDLRGSGGDLIADLQVQMFAGLPPWCLSAEATHFNVPRIVGVIV